VDYRAGGVPEALRDFAPDGLTGVFDNVGGVLLENALDRLAHYARVALCGSISSGYTVAGYGAGPANYMQLAFRRARMEGFIFFDHQPHFPEVLSRLVGWVSAGELRWAADVIERLHNAPAALQRLFDGANIGKQLVRVGSAGTSAG
jgi:NADPH-dependent curcumin reductase CurA